jgi:CO/xanthine dehydrogenase FAD-binding subunit
VKPPPFRYAAPTTLDEALRLLAEHGDEASVLAGGQSLVPLLNMRLARPELLVDVNRVAGLDAITLDRQDGAGTVVRVGATTRARRLETSAEVAALLPVVGAALSHVGHPQIRNRTTVGGNIAHADPSSELPGVLAALEGEVVLTSQRGTRVVGWDDFFLSVFTTCREPEELVTEVRFPAAEGWRFDFVELARRHGDFPLVSLTVGTREEAGLLTGLRIAATGVGERVQRLRGAEALADGRVLDEALVAEVVAAARREVDPTADAAGSTAYRRSLLGTLLRRTLSDRPTAVAA